MCCNMCDLRYITLHHNQAGSTTEFYQIINPIYYTKELLQFAYVFTDMLYSIKIKYILKRQYTIKSQYALVM